MDEVTISFRGLVRRETQVLDRGKRDVRALARRPLDDGAPLPPVEDHARAEHLVALALDLHDRSLGEDDPVLSRKHLRATAGRDAVPLDDDHVPRREEVLEAAVLAQGGAL